MKKIIEKVYLEIKTSGENAKEEALNQIESLLNKHPNSLKLMGCLLTSPRTEGDFDICLEINIDNPDAEEIKNNFPDSKVFEGVLFLHISERWEE